MALSALIMSGCNSTNSYHVFDPPLNSTFSVPAKDIILVRPNLEEREQYQLLIVHLTQLLSQPEATHEQKAQILYQLGIIYDRLGLDVTARTMFVSSLIEVPDYAKAYNFLGIYLASTERFSESYDAYDAVLEIDPEETYAYFNRGIALYYGNRAELALIDLKKFYEYDSNDPFRIAWLYIVEHEVYGQEQALTNLKERQAKLKGDIAWGPIVLDFLAGEKSESEVIASIREANVSEDEQGRRLCEAYFYMAKQAALEGKFKHAYDLFHLALTGNVTGYLEYRYALLEIDRFERKEQVAQMDRQADLEQEKRSNFFKQQADEARQYFEKLKQENPDDPLFALPPKTIPIKEVSPNSTTTPATPAKQSTPAKPTTPTKPTAPGKPAKPSK